MSDLPTSYCITNHFNDHEHELCSKWEQHLKFDADCYLCQLTLCVGLVPKPFGLLIFLIYFLPLTWGGRCVGPLSEDAPSRGLYITVNLFARYSLISFVILTRPYQILRMWRIICYRYHWNQLSHIHRDWRTCTWVTKKMNDRPIGLLNFRIPRAHSSRVKSGGSW